MCTHAPPIPEICGARNSLQMRQDDERFIIQDCSCYTFYVTNKNLENAWYGPFLISYIPHVIWFIIVSICIYSILFCVNVASFSASFISKITPCFKKHHLYYWRPIMHVWWMNWPSTLLDQVLGHYVFVACISVQVHGLIPELLKFVITKYMIAAIVNTAWCPKLLSVSTYLTTSPVGQWITCWPTGDVVITLTILAAEARNINVINH